jgi:hypothetical protein
MRVRGVPVGDEQRLVLREAELVQHAIGDRAHRGAVHRIGGVEADGEVVDGLLRADGQVRRRPHDAGGGLWIVGRKVAGVDPLHPVPLLPVRARLQVRDDPAKAASQAVHLPDHGA